MLRSLSIFFMAYSLIACTSGFKPPPPAFDRWQKPNVTKLEIKIALLECGYPTPSGISAGNSNDEIARWNRCMKNSGFSKDEYFCDGLHNPPPSCQPDAIIPTRNVERRLNSAYCKGYGKNTPECLPLGQEHIPQQQTQPQQQNSGDTNIPIREYPDKALQLERDIQNQNNKQMKNILKNTNPSIR